uniref:Uncharacterized protein n=1 Tax=Magallana gigas TaxID=29159 RepID=A0A8W8J5D3_MAGGI
MMTGCDVTWRDPVLKPYHLDEKPGLSKFYSRSSATVTYKANESTHRLILDHPTILAADFTFRWYFQILEGAIVQERVAKALAKTSRTIYSKEYKTEAQINVAMLDKHQAKKASEEEHIRCDVDRVVRGQGGSGQRRERRTGLMTRGRGLITRRRRGRGGRDQTPNRAEIAATARVENPQN